MKIRKLTGILVALAMIASYGTAMNITAGADTTVGWSYSQGGEINGTAVTYVGIDELFANGLSNDIHDYFAEDAKRTAYEKNIYVSLNNDGTFPVCVTADNLKAIRAYEVYDSTYSIKLNFVITNPVDGIKYTATISSDNMVNKGTVVLTDKQLAAIDSVGALNLALSFKTGNEMLTISGHNILMSSDVTFPVEYCVSNTYFTPLLTQCGLNNSGIINSDEVLALYAIGGDEDMIDKEVIADHSLEFTMTNECRKGVFLKYRPKEDYYTKKEAEDEVIRPYLYKYLGFNSSGLIPSIDSTFSNAKDFIEDTAIPGIKKMIPDYSTYNEIIEAVDDYCYENKPEFIEVFATDVVLASDSKIDAKVKDAIDKILGNSNEGAADEEETKDALYDYVYKNVINDVKEQLTTYGTPVNNALANTVEKAVENMDVSSIRDKLLRDDNFLTLLSEKLGTVKGEKGDTGNSAYQDAVEKGYFSGTFAEWLETLQGDVGDTGNSAYEEAVEKGYFKGTYAEWLQALQGEDGQDFEDWMKKKYGDEDGFMNEVFKKWAVSNYGSVNNFVNSINGEDGQSFESWMKSKYGSENAFMIEVFESWIEDEYGSVNKFEDAIRGEDGKSAYEIAVEEGFRGDEEDWLESLKGEDGEDGENGKDGEDGRDGADGQVIYVNGTYGQVPNNSTTTDDVVLSTDNVYYGKPGNVNPATGVAAGIVLPAAAIGSVLLAKKSKRRRGRK